MKCYQCGAELSDDTKFCSYCGNKIEADVPPPIHQNPEEDTVISKKAPPSKTHRQGFQSNKGQNNNISVENILKSHKKTSLILLAAITLFVLFIGILIQGLSSVHVPYDAIDCIGKDYSEIESSFRTAGFKNITIEKLSDLQITETGKANTIESILIDGNANFTKKEKFNNSSEIIIRCHTFEKRNINVHVKFISNLLFSKYNVNLLLDEEEIGTLTHGEDGDFEFAVEPGEHTLTFRSSESSSVRGIVTLSVDCDMEVSYKISCNKDNVDIETLYIDRKTELAENEVKVNLSASEYRYKNYQEVSDALKLLGFTNIKFEVLYDIVFGITDEGSVEIVSISNNKDFTQGDIFQKDSPVIITYHMKQSDDPNRVAESSNPEISTPSEVESSESVSYSTNDKSTVKNGNTGIYSYKSMGHQYDIYWIIDFDESYVYYFCDGNGDETCDKVKIDSGNLNDSVTITYHDGDTTWQYYLHFKWKNQPDTLIVTDNNNFDYQYSTTNLNDALTLRDTKRIIDR